MNEANKTGEVNAPRVDQYEKAPPPTLTVTALAEANKRRNMPAQEQHSPLPWRIGYNGMVHDASGKLVNSDADRALAVHACNNAQRLADALNKTTARLDYWHNKRVLDTKDDAAITQARAALAQWEKSNV